MQYKPFGGKSIDLNDVLDRANRFSVRFVPKQLAAKFPSVMPVAFVGMYAAAFLIVVAVIASVSSALGHDLSGTYRTSEFFPVNQITFQTDGSFTAVNYSGYTETYQGRYTKKPGGKYSLSFTGGSASGGSPVTQYEASSIGAQYELEVTKINETTLAVRVIPKIGYWAWSGTTVYFYAS